MTDRPVPGEPDGLGELGRELRDRVGEEWRREAEEGERLAELARRRKRTLADLAREHAERGVAVRVAIGARTVTGAVAHAAGDLVTLETVAGRVHLRVVDATLTADPTRPVPPRPGREDGVDRWRTRMYELELAGVAVRVALADGRDLGGVLAAVATDHLLLRTAEREEHALADGTVAWVVEEADAVT